MAKLLLQGGTVLIHGENDVVAAQKVDVLVEGTTIVKIGESLDASGAEVVDCSRKIISPGFVDTHHHCWQTQLKGRHANHMLLEYLPTGNLIAYVFNPENVFIGQLGGLMELVDSGVTTVVDHFHAVYSPEHADAALRATVKSGIRSIFCYSTVFRAAEWNLENIAMDPNPLPDWFLAHFIKLASQTHAAGRVEIGFGYDLFFIGEDANKMVFKTVREAGAKLITTHWANKSPVFGAWSNITTMDQQQLAGPDILVSHGCQMNDEDAAVLDKHGISVSSTPMTELQMGLGVPVCFDPRFQNRAGLGVDCHSAGAGDMITQMRVGLQAERGMFNKKYVDEGKNPSTCKQTVEQAFNLATIGGARACKMGDSIGSIAVGKKADFVIFDAESPAMICAAQQNPVAAIVLHSSIRDIDTVIVDGVIRKKDGKLLAVEGETGGEWTWKDIAMKLDKSYQDIEEKCKGVSYEVALKSMQAAFQLDPNSFPKV
ncbi:hypothetical protein H072_7782 [Dactylellina haptotyla CBS 200.50]|uniref:Amidohydrolase-related domain-containing protein n=1 Tax=Dactylellina haptotyla (strain CBS 200.50) TaxID=1284197 RepID=S8BTC8_DACHA|nr:hypothetical protein H072_7782 [Dactylellina haptotyla CBS 200.50]